MSDKKLYSGAVLRRFRLSLGETQVAFAASLDISPSYLNLMERNQRPISAQILLRLTERHDFDTRQLLGSEPGGGVMSLKKRLADPLFDQLEQRGDDIDQWIANAPGSAAAFAHLFDMVKTQRSPDHMSRQLEQGVSGSQGYIYNDPIQDVRAAIERWRGHFADLDQMAEDLAEDLRLGMSDLGVAINERLRVKYQIMVRVLPHDVAGGQLVQFDLHSRQLRLSEWLDGPSRQFASATLLARYEAEDQIRALVDGADLTNDSASSMFERFLRRYFAAAILMPYGRFLRAAESSGYDFDLLQRRFSVSFEQLAHRLTSLQRVGARGLPFFLLRVDRAGQISKRLSGGSGQSFLNMGAMCPLWNVTGIFGELHQPITQLVEMEGEGRYFTVARTVNPYGLPVERGGSVHAVILGLAAEHARSLVLAVGMDLGRDAAQPIGPGCLACPRRQCGQRSVPPYGARVEARGENRGAAPYELLD